MPRLLSTKRILQFYFLFVAKIKVFNFKFIVTKDTFTVTLSRSIYVHVSRARALPWNDSYSLLLRNNNTYAHITWVIMIIFGRQLFVFLLVCHIFVEQIMFTTSSAAACAFTVAVAW